LAHKESWLFLLGEALKTFLARNEKYVSIIRKNSTYYGISQQLKIIEVQV
jgi:hypothetical protein